MKKWYSVRKREEIAKVQQFYIEVKDIPKYCGDLQGEFVHSMVINGNILN